jgi:hypothetical protein
VFERHKVLKDKKPEIVECLKSPSLSDLQDNRITYHKICYRKLSSDRVHLLPRIPVEIQSSSGESSRVSRSLQDTAAQGCIFGDKTKLLSETLHDVQTLTYLLELEKTKRRELGLDENINPTNFKEDILERFPSLHVTVGYAKSVILVVPSTMTEIIKKNLKTETHMTQEAKILSLAAAICRRVLSSFTPPEIHPIHS